MKNAYEIRSDVLAMAKDYMDKQIQLNLDTYKVMADKYKDTWVEFSKLEVPKMYSTEELMEKAKEFYTFVNK